MATMAALLIPAGSVLFGGLITGGFTVASQSLTNRGTFKRERDARHESFRVRRFEIERETLMSLQDSITQYMRTFVLLRGGHGLKGEAPLDSFELNDQLAKVTALTARTSNDDARMCVHHYLIVAHELSLQDEDIPVEDLVDAYGKAQTALGDALRRDPFTDGP
jgi:hypothetical protein